MFRQKIIAIKDINWIMDMRKCKWVIAVNLQYSASCIPDTMLEKQMFHFIFADGW